MATFTEYTDPAVDPSGVLEGWAEPAADPMYIDWPERQAGAAIPFKVVDGRPVNPCEKTLVQRGRNGLGRWGENLMADALVTCEYEGVRWLLMIERGDGHGWAVPGGSVDPGETPAEASVRELAEETGLTVPVGLWRSGEPMYVPDPRASDEAWAVTVPAYADLGTVDQLPYVTGADDANRAAWVRTNTYEGLAFDLADRFGGEVFPAHVAMLKDFCAQLPSHGYYVVYAVTSQTGPQRFEAVVVSLPYRLDTSPSVRRLTNNLSNAIGAPVVITNWLPLLEVA